MTKSSDIREKLTAEILKRKSASYKEIITANYGEWPLRGLDIVSDDHLDVRVNIIGMREAVALMIDWEQKKRAELNQKPLGLLDKLRLAKAECSGYYGKHFSQGNQVWVNSLKPIRQRVSTLAHERRHSQQYSFRTRTQPVSKTIFNRFVSYEKDGTVDQEKIINQSSWLAQRPIEDNLAEIYNGTEVQARIEQLLAHGYPGWPHMPLNKAELWASMTNLGLVPPPGVQEKLDNDRDYLTAKKAFACSPDSITEIIARNVNMSISLLPSQKAQNAFWLMGLPLLYGDILQSYGDRLAVERLNMGKNDQMPYTIFRPEYEKIYTSGFADEETKAAIAHKASKLGEERLTRHLAFCKREFRTSSNEDFRGKIAVIIGQLEINLEKISGASRPSGAGKSPDAQAAGGPG